MRRPPKDGRVRPSEQDMQVCIIILVMVQKSGKLTSWYGKYPLIYDGFYTSQVVVLPDFLVPIFPAFKTGVFHLQVDARMEDFQRLSTDTMAGDIGTPDRQQQHTHRGLIDSWDSWVFPKNWGIFPQNGWVKIRESPIRIDDLGVPLFSETSS